MTTKQYVALRPYAEKFNTSRAGYVRVTKTEMDAFSDVYKDIYGKEVNRSQRTCPRCILKLFKAVAEDFWAFEKSPAYKKLMKSEKDGNEGSSVD